MKTKQFITLCVFCSLAVILSAQNVKNFTNIQKIKGINNSYNIGEEKIAYSVWNINNKYKDIVPKYLYNEVIPSIGIENRATIDNLVCQYLKSYFIKYNTFTYPYLYIYLYGDIDGNIKEICIIYPKNIGLIPLTVIEQFEVSLLKSNVKLLFNKNNNIFSESEWVGREVMYSMESLKKL